jgi:hypothetical protein
MQSALRDVGRQLFENDALSRHWHRLHLGSYDKVHEKRIDVGPTNYNHHRTELSIVNDELLEAACIELVGVQARNVEHPIE